MDTRNSTLILGYHQRNQEDISVEFVELDQKTRRYVNE